MDNLSDIYGQTATKGDIGVILAPAEINSGIGRTYIGCFQDNPTDRSLDFDASGGVEVKIQTCVSNCASNNYRYAALIGRTGYSKTQGKCYCGNEFGIPTYKYPLVAKPGLCPTYEYPSLWTTDDMMEVYEISDPGWRKFYIGLIAPQHDPTQGCTHYGATHCEPNKFDNTSFVVSAKSYVSNINLVYIPCPGRTNEETNNVGLLQTCIASTGTSATINNTRYCYCSKGLGECEIDETGPETASSLGSSTTMDNIPVNRWATSRTFNYLHGNAAIGSIAVFDVKNQTDWRVRTNALLNAIEGNSQNRHTTFNNCPECRRATTPPLSTAGDEDSGSSSGRRRRRRRRRGGSSSSSSSSNSVWETPVKSCPVETDVCTATLTCDQRSPGYEQLGEKSFLYPSHGCAYPLDIIGGCSSFCASSGTPSQVLTKADVNWYSYTNRIVPRKTYALNEFGDVCLQCDKDEDCKTGLACNSQQEVVGCLFPSTGLTTQKYCSAVPSNFVNTATGNNNIPPYVSSITNAEKSRGAAPVNSKTLLLASADTNITNVGISYVPNGFFHRKNVSYTAGVRGAICLNRVPVKSPKLRNCHCRYNPPIQKKDCTFSKQCGPCESSCNTDDDCSGDLVCAAAAFGFGGYSGSSSSRSSGRRRRRRRRRGSSSSGTSTSIVPIVDKGANGCTTTQKCTECQGDCDDDEDCADGLVCFQRTYSYDRVPGCGTTGYVKSTSEHDYCSRSSSTSDGSSTSTVSGNVWYGTETCPFKGDLKYGERFCTEESDDARSTSGGFAENCECSPGYSDSGTGSDYEDSSKSAPTFEDAMYQCNNFLSGCTGIMEYAATNIHDVPNYFMCKS